MLTPDAVASRPHDAKRVWSAAGLTDGHSSTGRLIALRPWIQKLAKRFDLEAERRELIAERESILARTRTTALAAAFAGLAVVIVALVIWQIRTRLNARKNMHALRRRIAGDLHDEVGSNLATISLLAEMSENQAQENSAADISRLARESSLSLREIIDFTLVPKRVRKPLPERLREIAAVMLRGIEWNLTESGALELDLERRRNFVFFFKEALHNIIRHAGASRVELRIETTPHSAILRVSDDGVGLPVGEGGPAFLRTLEQRAEALEGHLDVRSSAGRGTALELVFPLKSPRRPRTAWATGNHCKSA